MSERHDPPHYVLSALFRYERKNDVLVSAYDYLSEQGVDEVLEVFSWAEQNSEQAYLAIKEAMLADKDNK